MKKIAFLSLLTVILLSSCSVGYFNVTLDNVNAPVDVKQQFGESKIVMLQTIEDKKAVTKYCYEDSIMKIVWLYARTQFLFTLTNKTTHSIKIIWDDAAYINENNISLRIMHSGVKYIDKANEQPPTIVPKGTTVNELVLPTNSVNFISSVGWVVSPLFTDSGTPDVIKSTYVGKTVQVLLPIKIEDVTNEYTFVFKIQDFKTY